MSNHIPTSIMAKMKNIEDNLQHKPSNTDYDLADIITRYLTEFINNPGLSIPNSIYSSFEGIADQEKREAASLEEWNNILNEMLFGFSEPEHYSDYSEDDNPYDRHEEWVDPETRQFKVLYKSSWSQEQIEAWELKRTEYLENQKLARIKGRMLFAKYFDDLWT